MQQGGTAGRQVSTSSGAPWTCRTSRSSAGPGRAWECACLRAQSRAAPGDACLLMSVWDKVVPHAPLWQLRGGCQPAFGVTCLLVLGSSCTVTSFPETMYQRSTTCLPDRGPDETCIEVTTAGQGSMAMRQPSRRLAWADAGKGMSFWGVGAGRAPLNMVRSTPPASMFTIVSIDTPILAKASCATPDDMHHAAAEPPPGLRRSSQHRAGPEDACPAQQ
jgi:hypothetical protein